MNKVIFIIVAIITLTLVVSGIAGCPKEEVREEELKCISPIFEEGEAAEELVERPADTSLTFKGGGLISIEHHTFDKDINVKWIEETNFTNLPENLTLLSAIYSFALPENVSLNKWIALILPHHAENEDKDYIGVYCYLGNSNWQYIKTLKAVRNVGVVRIKTDGTFAVFKSDRPLPRYAKVELKKAYSTTDPRYPQRKIQGYKFDWKDPISDGWEYAIQVSKDLSFNETSLIVNTFTGSQNYFFSSSLFYELEKGKIYHWRVNRVLPKYIDTDEWSEVNTFKP